MEKYKCPLFDNEIAHIIKCNKQECIDEYRDLCQCYRRTDIEHDHCRGKDCHNIMPWLSYATARCIKCQKRYCAGCLKMNIWVSVFYGYSYCNNCIIWV